MDKAKQILEESLSYKNCDGLIEENSRLEDAVLYAINQALLQAHVIKSLLADLPENRPLYKDSGLWQMRSDDMEEVLIQQGVNETDLEFIARCKASNVL